MARPPSHGERRGSEILASAVDLASAEGLAGLSIGRLASETGLSRSGVFAHFGSKQQLQALAAEAETARRQGELREHANADALAFRLHALVQQANWARELFSDFGAFERARDAIRDTLEELRP